MFSFGRKKKEKSFESKIDELDTVLLSESDYRDAKKIEQYVVERLEQMIEAAKEVEDETDEYRMVTSYLNDIQLLEEMPQEEKAQIVETAQNVVQLNKARTEFLNSAKKLSDAQFAQIEQQEQEIPDAIKRLRSNELYRDTLRKDMRYLEREKSEWALQQEYLGSQQRTLKNLLYVILGLAVTGAVLLVILKLVFELEFRYGWIGLLAVTALAICGIILKMQNDRTELRTAERSRNRAITLQNKVKIKYVNVENAVDYACEKYHVRSASELEQQWEYYLEAVREQEKYQRTNEDLEYFKGRLVRILSKYKFYDAQVWLSQAAALVDPKEMVEAKHELVTRRQKLRSRIEYNMNVIREQRAEAEQLLDKVGDELRPQVEQILASMENFEETL